MSDDSTVLCRRCGFANTRGDQFCGSCGAFLEWEGQPLATNAASPGGDAQAAPPASGTTTPTTGGTVTPITAPPTQPWPDATPTTPKAASPPSPGAGELVRCPACGIANPVGRTFCQVCGATLAGAAEVREASREQIVEAVAAPSRLATAPVPAGATRPAGRDVERARRGIPGWLVGVALLGIAAGVGFVVVTQVLRPAAPEGGAGVTQAPGGGGSPAPGSTGGAPGESAAPTGAPGPTGAPAVVELKLNGATASSVVGNRAKFQPEKAIDGNTDTCWQEGSADEDGEWIEVTFDAARADTLLISNGHQASSALYKGNRRLRDILVSVDGLDAIKVRLKDTMKVQRVALGGIPGASSVKITIVNTYAPKRTSVDGTPFDDAAVAEIAVLGVPGQ